MLIRWRCVDRLAFRASVSERGYLDVHEIAGM